MTNDLDAFIAEAHAFVASHHPRLDESVAPEGSDAVTVIPERPVAQEKIELADALAWRRTSFDAGFGWIDGPAAHGGRDLPASFAAAYREVERTYRVPDEGYTRFSVGILCPTLLAHAGDELLGEFLTPLRRADVVSCQLFSEPGAGSDLASVRTRATRDGDEWRIDGQKVWTSGAHYSSVGMLLARTDPTSRTSRGLTVFLIDMDQPGIEVRPIRQLTGGAAFSEVFLDGARVPDARRIGEIDAGWQVITTTLMHERAVIGSDGAVDLALVPRLVDLARAQGVDDDPRVRDAIADVYVRAEANSLMTQMFLDRATNGLPGPEMSLSKLLLTDNLQRISDIAQDILGPRFAADTGEAATFGWSQLALSLPGLRIGGGTDEILRTIVAQRVLDLPRPAR
jgi:alkylation response protein AidB-like acyl-CoA dehydrogenase